MRRKWPGPTHWRLLLNRKCSDVRNAAPFSYLLAAIFNTCDQCSNPVNDSSTGDIKIAVARSTEAAVLRWHIVGSFDVAKVLAFGAEYLNPSRGCGKSVARAVNA